ncbi:DUF6933 domain-containing protein [Cryptosporangium aurantiacum]|uniref:DUF6933 domain-containing protein n=1 Tax=Cryptosporangium aurantiacum TaxID=134849 RepID=A0A1M7RE98_9ACTN|nr:hypothetical protein [Cryptosporangium aurantiacum]SHN44637.1 hypothetical protein SAMN05443668_110293 [Cryptosporangium aurantiacum]
MFVVHATKKLLDRIGPSTLQQGEESTAALGAWYATVLFWRPQVVLWVNEQTLLPVLMPLAPAATLATRFPAQLATVLTAHGIPDSVIEAELARMADVRIAKTANRSVVGIMTEFTHLAEVYRAHDPASDPLGLAVRLAATPCGPLYSRHVSPDRELRARLQPTAPPPS